MCGSALGFRSAEQDHRAAGKLLEAAGPDGAKLAPKFVKLASDKTILTYGGWCTRAAAAQAVRSAGAFIEVLDRLNL